MKRSTAAFVFGGAGLMLASLVACESPTVAPTPEPPPVTTTTTTTQPPVNNGCDLPVPPLVRINISFHTIQDPDTRILNARPVVINQDEYCQKQTGRSGYFCFTTREGDSDMAACDQAAVGQAVDTGRWGPTWFWESQPCAPGANPGCTNNPQNQFLVRARGNGVFEACASHSIPLSEDPNWPGTRCSRCVVHASGQLNCE